MASTKKNIQHLYLRAGFGATPLQVETLKSKSNKQLIDKIFLDSQPIASLNRLKNPIRGKEASNLKIALLILRSKEQIKTLNLAWLEKLSTDQAQLREKMTLFWHGHFATKVPFAYLMQIQNNTLRKHALGNFRSLLQAIAKDPAMLIFLNNQQNKKHSPNENFARELMELFTLGEGNYSEFDIKEAARAFTGWQVSKGGKFFFNTKQHDFGSKTVFGCTGNWNGEDVINMILDNPKTAEFIARKVYNFFVNDLTNENRVKELGKYFFESNYDITALMKYIFLADWFYEDGNIGSKISSPIELIVRYRRLFNIQLRDDELWLRAQMVLGQALFNPPNVAGWPGGNNWIDSSSLMFRMNLAPLFFEYERVGKWSDSKSDWSNVMGTFQKGQPDQMISQVLESFIQIDASSKKELIRNYIPNQDIKQAVIRTMMLPEFQLI